MGRPRKTKRNKLRSIHDPSDPSPRVLPADARAHWDGAYDEAMEVYGKKDLAKKSAWRETKLRWKQTGKKTWRRCKDGVCYWPQPMQAPMPHMDLVGLGVLIEYVFIDRHGEMHVRELDSSHPPILWWDDALKVLYAFPKAPYPTCALSSRDVDSASIEIYERWHQRPPECFDEIGVPDVRINPVGAADSLSYASDKWNDRNPDPALRRAQQYIHNHWYDVWAWQDTDRGVPNVILIEGGELDLHERGLIH